MRQRTWDHAAVLPITFIGLMFLFLSSFVNTTSSGAVSVSATKAKCEIDISGVGTDCTLIKKNDERILWTNPSSKHRSVYFNHLDSPFAKECWDVPGHGGSAKSGKIIVGPDPTGHAFYTSDSRCSSELRSDPIVSTPKVIIQ